MRAEAMMRGALREVKTLPKRMLKIEGRKRFEDMTDIEASYLACLVDGEGTVTVYIKAVGYVCVRIGMTAIGFIRQLCDKWGGGFYIYERKGLKCKPCAHWYISKEDGVYVFLQKIMPYLQVKRPQVELALRMLNMQNEDVTGWRDKWSYMVKEMRKLNKRGR
jgi:hypothetical protein